MINGNKAAAALSGTAAESFECLTVIENQEFWSEKEARAALRRLERDAIAEQDPQPLLEVAPA